MLSCQRFFLTICHTVFIFENQKFTRPTSERAWLLTDLGRNTFLWCSCSCDTDFNKAVNYSAEVANCRGLGCFSKLLSR